MCPANPYYDSTGYPSNGAAGSAASMRSELDLVEAGFNKLPVLTAKNNLPVFVDSGGSALEAKTAAAARTALDVYSKAETLAVSVPVGTIAAWVGGYFGDGLNGSFTNVLGNTVAAANAYLNASGWYVCDGAAVNSASSAISRPAAF